MAKLRSDKQELAGLRGPANSLPGRGTSKMGCLGSKKNIVGLMTAGVFPGPKGKLARHEAIKGGNHKMPCRHFRRVWTLP